MICGILFCLKERRESDNECFCFNSPKYRGKSFVFPEWIRDYLAERCDVKYSPLDRQIVPEEMVQYAADADVIITGWGHPTITKEMIAKTNVHLVVHTGGSVGSLIDPDIYDIGVRVISGNDLYADSVAEGTLAFMMAMLRQIPDYVDNIRNGGWNFQENCTEGLYNQRIGIVGFGAISKRVVQLLRPFNVNIKIYSGYPIDEQFLHDNNAKQVTLDELFSTCRIVSLHSSMNEKIEDSLEKSTLNAWKMVRFLSILHVGPWLEKKK